MTAPLALFLTNFSAPALPVAAMIDFSDDLIATHRSETPMFDLDAEVERAVDAAKAEAQELHEAEMEALRTAHAEELTQAIAAAREEWLASTASTFTAGLDGAMDALRTGLSDGLAAVLRPLVGETVRQRASRELADVLDRLVADASQPILRVKGPEDLCAALHAARPAVEIDWVIDESTDIEMIAGSTHIETKLAAALADIAATES